MVHELHLCSAILSSCQFNEPFNMHCARKSRKCGNGWYGVGICHGVHPDHQPQQGSVVHWHWSKITWGCSRAQNVNFEILLISEKWFFLFCFLSRKGSIFYWPGPIWHQKIAKFKAVQTVKKRIDFGIFFKFCAVFCKNHIFAKSLNETKKFLRFFAWFYTFRSRANF